MTNELESEIIKELLLPELEREVNQGQHFAPLRQIYYSMILAKWYKETIKNSLVSEVYIDQKKISGIALEDQSVKDRIYAQYIQAYRKGVYDCIKEDYDRLNQQMIPRKYFSGGIVGDVALLQSDQAMLIPQPVGPAFSVDWAMIPQREDPQGRESEPTDGAMLTAIEEKIIEILKRELGVETLSRGSLKKVITEDFPGLLDSQKRAINQSRHGYGFTRL